MKNRPAETGGVAAALALLLARALGLSDADLIVALGIVIGFIPAGITWVVSTARGGRVSGERGYTLVDVLLIFLIVILVLVVLAWFLPGR